MNSTLKTSLVVKYVAAFICLLSGAREAVANASYEGFQQPPRAMLEVLESRSLPSVSVSPDGKWLLLADRKDMISGEELSAPVLSLARHAIDPRTNGSYGTPNRSIQGYTLVRTADLKRWRLVVPENKLSDPLWSPDSRHFVFLHTAEHGIELWSGNVEARQARALTGAEISAARAPWVVPCSWMLDSRHILCTFVPQERGVPPLPTATASEQLVIQKSDGDKAPVLTRGGLLSNAYDEAMYDYYMTSQAVLLDVTTGIRQKVAPPAIYETLKPSPNGEYLLSVRIVRPYSYLVSDDHFPKEVEILDMRGNRVRSIGHLPADESGSSLTGWAFAGPRRFTWVPGSEATLAYLEALDGGDPQRSAEYRDRLVILAAPFTSAPQELLRTRGRMVSYPVPIRWESGATGNLAWGSGGEAWVEEYDRTTHRKRVWVVKSQNVNAEPIKLLDVDTDDTESDPGRPLFTLDARGQEVFLREGNWVYLHGEGSSPQGDLPFLDRINLQTGKRERLFRAHERTYEAVAAVLDPGARKILTRYESPLEPPNYRVRDLRRALWEGVTTFPHPAPELATVSAKRISYVRGDGVSLSGDLYLPAGYVPGQRLLPAVIWAYPKEYVRNKAVGQIQGSPYRFPWSAEWPFERLIVRLLVTQGYAVLMDASMPVIGGRDANNTAAEQFTANAKAAVDALVAMRVADRNRIGVAGASYGGLMTATLLGHSKLFSAGVALSGVYNLTLTPFGFQNEGRTLWQASDTYMQLSALVDADKITAPLLLIHGERDDNAAAAPMQSLQMYRALAGLGRTARLVMLPNETHGYSGRQSVLHIAWEVSSWFDRYLKPEQAMSAVRSP